MIKNCKKFFDLIATAFLNETESVTKLLDEKDYLLENFYQDDNELKNTKNGINKKLEEISKCKVPEIATRERLISKYLEEFMSGLVEPNKQSFSNATLDTLLHPDKYADLRNKSSLPDFENFKSRNKNNVFQKKREMVMNPIHSDLEKQIDKLKDVDSDELREKFENKDSWLKYKELGIEEVDH